MGNAYSVNTRTVQDDLQARIKDNLTELLEQISKMDRPDQILLMRLIEKLTARNK